jgi:ParB family chromosome partitioning protein
MHPDQVEDLVTSIEALGLMQPLCGLRVSGVHTEIVAGGRRFRALQEIARRTGVSPEAFTVPVTITDDPEIARAWAGAQNVVRQPLTPVQEVRAFGQMSEGGHTVETISNAFGVPQRHVQGRLKLAALPEPIIAAFEAGEISFETAKAYTLAADHEQALEVFNDLLENNWSRDNPREVKTRLMAETTAGDNRVAKFVGQDAYEAAGGEVRCNLFGEDVYFADKTLLSRLALEGLEEERSALLAEGWKWVEVSVDSFDYDTLSRLGRTYAKQVEASEEEATRYDELADREEDWTPEEEAEFDALQAKLDVEVFSTEQKALAGVFLSISYNGTLARQEGYVRDTERLQAIEAGIIHANHHQSGSSGSQQAVTRFPKAVMDDLSALRTSAVQKALLAKPELALDLLTFALIQPIYSGAGVMEVSVDHPQNAVASDEGHVLPERLEKRHVDWVRADDAADAFTTFRAKTKKARTAALTEAIARLVSVGMDSQANPLGKHVAELVKPDLRSVWTPTESFLKRLKASDLDAITAHIDGVGCGSTCGPHLAIHRPGSAHTQGFRTGLNPEVHFFKRTSCQT